LTASVPSPGASIPLASLPNLRDLGGWAGADGRRIRSGLLFRSTDLSKLTPDDRAALDQLGIGTIYDFRSAAERTTEPDVALDGVQEVVLDVLADAPHAVPGNLTKVLSDPATLAAARAELGGRGVVELMESSYGQLVTLPSARASYRLFFRGLLGDHPVPALFHCTTGKDRTGWAAASFLTLMGVTREDVLTEYLLTNEQLIPALRSVFDAFARAGGDPEMLRPVLGVDRTYLELAFAAMEASYGTIESYFADGLGIGATDQQRLLDSYLT
jgi:protein-tyrosine phosphatase